MRMSRWWTSRPGMVVHPAAGHATGTLVNALLHHVSGLSGIGGAERPGIVHRLDRGTSGVMVVAKTDARAPVAVAPVPRSASRQGVSWRSCGARCGRARRCRGRSAAIRGIGRRCRAARAKTRIGHHARRQHRTARRRVARARGDRHGPHAPDSRAPERSRASSRGRCAVRRPAQERAAAAGRARETRPAVPARGAADVRASGRRAVHVVRGAAAAGPATACSARCGAPRDTVNKVKSQKSEVKSEKTSLDETDVTTTTSTTPTSSPRHARPVFPGRVFRVDRDRVRLPNGRTATLDIVRHRGSVVLIPQPSPTRSDPDPAVPVRDRPMDLGAAGRDARPGRAAARGGAARVRGGNRAHARARAEGRRVLPDAGLLR